MNKPTIIRKDLSPYIKQRIIELLAEGRTPRGVGYFVAMSEKAVRKFCANNDIAINEHPKEAIKFYKPGAFELKAQKQATYSLGKPSVLEIAQQTLGDDLLLGDKEHKLRVNGKYQTASLDEIMKRLNMVRVDIGLSQITINPRWCI